MVVPTTRGDHGDNQSIDPAPKATGNLGNTSINAAEVAKDMTGMSTWSLSLFCRDLLAELAPAWSQQGFILGELGCGTCPVLLPLFPSPVYHGHACASEIILFDYNSKAVALVNKSEELLACRKLGWTTSAQVLDWSKPILSNYRGYFDVFIGSEILYYATALGEILSASKYMMKKNGVFILVSSLRGMGLDDISYAAEQADVTVHFLDLHVAKEALKSVAVVDGYNVFCVFKNKDNKLDGSNVDSTDAQSQSVIARQDAIPDFLMKQWAIPDTTIAEEIEDYDNENDIFAAMNIF